MSSLPVGGTPFVFTSIGPGGDGSTIRFRAHITDISDSNSSSWNEESDMGRATPKYMYGGWSRTISVSFQVVMATRDEPEIWIGAMNSLAEMTKPVYRSGQGFNGVLTNMVIGKLYNVPGILESVDYSINGDTPWIDDRPVYFEASISFKVIQNRRPEYKRSDTTFVGGENNGFGTGRSR